MRIRMWLKHCCSTIWMQPTAVREEGTLLAENYLGNGEKVSWAGLVGS